MDREHLGGLDLARACYADAVRPILDAAYPGLPHAAAQLSPGSEVLGFDTPRSTDHDWGPRLQLFLPPDGPPAAEVDDLLARRLPERVRGWPVRFAPAGRPPAEARHHVAVTDVVSFLTGRLGVDPTRPLAVTDWLAVPQQRLTEITAGAVFRDDGGTLAAVRSRLAWYPDQVWRWLLACGWQRVAQEEAFVGRCAEVGDHLGAAVLAARLARDLMRLCLLLERRYAPYNRLNPFHPAARGWGGCPG